MPRRLNASERAEREYQRMLESIRNEMRRELTRDAERLLNDLRRQLTEELQRSFLEASRQTGGTDGGSVSSFQNLPRLIGNILRLTAKPKTSSSTFETARSLDAFDGFRLSRGQHLAEMGDALGKGERNL